jgi:hypothetical protein
MRHTAPNVALAADRNRRASHRQLVANAVVAQPLKRNVGSLSISSTSGEERE